MYCEFMRTYLEIDEEWSQKEVVWVYKGFLGSGGKARASRSLSVMAILFLKFEGVMTSWRHRHSEIRLQDLQIELANGTIHAIRNTILVNQSERPFRTQEELLSTWLPAHHGIPGFHKIRTLGCAVPSCKSYPRSSEGKENI